MAKGTPGKAEKDIPLLEKEGSLGIYRIQYTSLMAKGTLGKAEKESVGGLNNIRFGR